MADIVVKPSPIEGRGVFAARAFAPGERIRRIDDSRTADDELIRRVEAGTTDFRLDDYPDRTVALPYPDGFFNHSCDPNAFDHWDDDGTRWTIARRRISAGDEITKDYRINGWGDAVWNCNCGAARCQRQNHADFFHLPPKLQREYLPLLAPWYAEMFPEKMAALRTRLAG